MRSVRRSNTVGEWGCVQQILQRRYAPAQRSNEVDRPVAAFMDGRLLRGVDTKHRTASGRLYRLRLRLRSQFKTMRWWG